MNEFLQRIQILKEKLDNAGKHKKHLDLFGFNNFFDSVTPLFADKKRFKELRSCYGEVIDKIFVKHQAAEFYAQINLN